MTNGPRLEIVGLTGGSLIVSSKLLLMMVREGVMATGLVKWFNNAKGWGFIAGRDGTDVFVHYSQIRGDGYRTLREGQHVQYDLRRGPRGQFAENVKVGENVGQATASG